MTTASKIIYFFPIVFILSHTYTTGATAAIKIEPATESSAPVTLYNLGGTTIQANTAALEQIQHQVTQLIARESATHKWVYSYATKNWVLIPKHIAEQINLIDNIVQKYLKKIQYSMRKGYEYDSLNDCQKCSVFNENREFLILLGTMPPKPTE